MLDINHSLARDMALPPTQRQGGISPHDPERWSDRVGSERVLAWCCGFFCNPQPRRIREKAITLPPMSMVPCGETCLLSSQHNSTSVERSPDFPGSCLVVSSESPFVQCFGPRRSWLVGAPTAPSLNAKHHQTQAWNPLVPGRALDAE